MQLARFAKILFPSLLFAFCSVSSAAEWKPDFSEPTSVLQEAIADRAFPGCAVAVGNAAGIVWSAAFGHLDYEDTQSVTNSTIYDLASLTKVVGTTSVYMRL